MVRHALLLLSAFTTAASAQLNEAQRLANARAFAAGTPACNRAAPDPDPATLSLVAVAPPDSLVDFTAPWFCLRVGQVTLAVTTEGPGVRLSDGRRFAIPVEKEESIASMVYGIRDGRLFLQYQVTLGTAGHGYLVALDSATLAPAWSRPARVSLNAGPVLFHGSSVYVSGLNMAARVERSTGRVLWSHVYFADTMDGWPRSHFMSFHKPFVAGDTVFFPERVGDGFGDTLAIRHDGIIVRPAFLKGKGSICAAMPVWCGGKD